MSERLNISPRSYSDLERGRSLCSMPVFVRFVLACCGEEKILGLFREMRRRLEGREDG